MWGAQAAIAGGIQGWYPSSSVFRKATTSSISSGVSAGSSPGLAVVGHLVDIHVGPHLRRQVIEFRDAARPARIQLFRIGVAAHVEIHDLAQRREAAVVEIGRRAGHVPQRRHLECAAKIAALRQDRCGTGRKARGRRSWDPRSCRISVLARQAKIVVGEIGEQRRRAVHPRSLGWQAAQLPFAGSLNSEATRSSCAVNRALPAMPCVVLAVEGMEVPALGLVSCERGDQARRRLASDPGITSSPKCVSELAKRRRCAQLLHQARDVGIRHLARVDERIVACSARSLRGRPGRTRPMAYRPRQTRIRA